MKRRLLMLVVATGYFFCGPLLAKEKPEWRSWPNGDRFYGSIGYYRPKLDTNVAIGDSQGDLGVLISFEKTLGLSESKGTAIVFLEWRISKRNSVTFDYFSLDRSSNKESGVAIKIGDNIIEGSLPIASFFDIESYDLKYNFSVIATKKNDLALGVGLAVQDLRFGIQGTEACNLPDLIDCTKIREQVGVTAPLPTVNVRWQHAFSDKWLFDSSLGWLAVELDLNSNEKLDGRIWNASAAVRWKTWKNVGFNLGYKYFDVDIDFEKRDLRATVDYDYRGFVFGIEGYY